jgi:hypothetical protein
MNAYVDRIVSLLKSERGLNAKPFVTEGADRSLYVQIVGVRGFPVFTVKPSGKYELPFENTYRKVDMKEQMGLPILDGESEGLNAVLFADKLAARTRNRHDLCTGYDYDTSAIERVRQMAAAFIVEESQMIWCEPATVNLEQSA